MDIPSSDHNHKNPESGFGPMAAIVIIVLLLAAGGIYFLVMQEIERHTTPPVGQEQALRN
jgi:hypothetical protein